MRLKITLRYCEQKFLFPFNYQYELSSILYKNMQKSDAIYSSTLHKDGFLHNGKKFKLFTFSDLIFHKMKATPKGILSLSDSLEWYISSPIEGTMEHIVEGTLAENFLQFRFFDQNYTFLVEKAEYLPPISFSEKMYFTCLSPLCIETMEVNKEKAKKVSVDYFTEKEKFEQILKKNLLQKYQLLYSKELDVDYFSFEFNPDYLQKNGNKICKKRRFKKNLPNIVCWQSPFRIYTHPSLIKVGYMCGFGSKNSNGFGMVKVI